MSKSENQIDGLLSEADKLKKLIGKSRTATVRNTDEISTVKAVAYAWFKNHRQFVSGSDAEVLRRLDELYKWLLESSDRQISRTAYTKALKEIRKNLLLCRSTQLIPVPATLERAPDFSFIAADLKMQSILLKRWEECSNCLSAKAPLAATVMMGGLLEALLLSKINAVGDKKIIIQAACAPKDHKTGKVKPLQEWGLKDYISVSHELGWISVSAKGVGDVLRDYRNYIHPFKQLTHGVDLTLHDAELFWEITKSITKQLTS